MHLLETFRPATTLVSRTIGLEAFHWTWTLAEKERPAPCLLAKIGGSGLVGIGEVVSPSAVRFFRNIEGPAITPPERYYRTVGLLGCILSDNIGIGIAIAAGVIGEDPKIALASKAVINMITHSGFKHVFQRD